MPAPKTRPRGGRKGGFPEYLRNCERLASSDGGKHHVGQDNLGVCERKGCRCDEEAGELHFGGIKGVCW